MSFIKDIQNNKTIILDHINENDTINVHDLKKEIKKKCERDGNLIICGKILDDTMKITEIKKIYKYWNNKIIYF